MVTDPNEIILDSEANILVEDGTSPR